jgi:hypothetical protein
MTYEEIAREIAHRFWLRMTAPGDYEARWLEAEEIVTEVATEVLHEVKP